MSKNQIGTVKIGRDSEGYNVEIILKWDYELKKKYPNGEPFAEYDNCRLFRRGYAAQKVMA